MTTLVLLLAFFLPPPANHLPTVTAMQPAVVTTLKPATSYLITKDGTILTCLDPNYGLYVSPMDTKQRIAFYYVMPPTMVKSTDKEEFIGTCLLVKR